MYCTTAVVLLLPLLRSISMYCTAFVFSDCVYSLSLSSTWGEVPLNYRTVNITCIWTCFEMQFASLIGSSSWRLVVGRRRGDETAGGGCKVDCKPFFCLSVFAWGSLKRAEIVAEWVKKKKKVWLQLWVCPVQKSSSTWCVNVLFTLPRLFTTMPPKRDAGATPAQPPIKMIKIDNVTDAQEFGCHSGEDKFRLHEEASYSPYPNNDVRVHCLIIRISNLCITWIFFMCSFSTLVAAWHYWIWWRQCCKPGNQNRHHQPSHENRAAAGTTEIWTQMQNFGWERAEGTQRWVGKNN